MSQAAAIATLTAYYEAFNRRDYAAMVALLTPEVAHDINQGRREVGRETFARFLETMDAAYREQLADIVVMAAADGQRGAAEFVVYGTYLTSQAGLPPARGQTYVLPAGAFFELAEGGTKIARVTTYYNLAQWLALVQ